MKRPLIRIAVILFVAFYGGTWAATAFWGVPAVHRDFKQLFIAMGERVDDGRVFTELDNDPHGRGEAWPDPPWYYIDAYSPCPFIVVADVGALYGPLAGYGGRYFRLWVFGITWELFDYNVWFS